MFIPHTPHYYKRCVKCKWCHERKPIKLCFTLKEGPSCFRFCDTTCSSKWVTYRHTIGVAHVIKMSAELRHTYLKGYTIDEFISNGMCIPCEAKQL